jgi:hypothetical protein
MIDISKIFVSFARETASELDTVLGTSGEFADRRRFLIPAINEGSVVPNTTASYFMVRIKLKGNFPHSDLVLFCSLVDGAPDDRMQKTMHVYKVVTCDVAVSMLQNFKLTSKIARDRYMNGFRVNPADSIEINNAVVDDTHIRYNGDDYDLGSMERQDILFLKINIEQNLSELNHKRSILDRKNPNDAKRDKYLSREHRSKGMLCNHLRGYLIRTKPFEKFFVEVAHEMLPADVYDALLAEANSRIGKSIPSKET